MIPAFRGLKPSTEIDFNFIFFFFFSINVIKTLSKIWLIFYCVSKIMKWNCELLNKIKIPKKIKYTSEMLEYRII